MISRIQRTAKTILVVAGLISVGTVRAAVVAYEGVAFNEGAGHFSDAFEIQTARQYKATVGGLITPQSMLNSVRAARVAAPAVVPVFDNRVGAVSHDALTELSSVGDWHGTGPGGDAQGNHNVAMNSDDHNGYNRSHRLSGWRGSRLFDPHSASTCMEFKHDLRCAALALNQLRHGDDSSRDTHDDHDQIVGGDWIYEFNHDHQDNRDNSMGAWGRSHHDWRKHHFDHGHGPPAVPIPPAVWLFGSALLGQAIVTCRRPRRRGNERR